MNKLPNNINLEKLGKLLKYSDRYEINIQFWPKQVSVYISKDGIDLESYGSDFDFAVDKSIEYLNRINKINTEYEKCPFCGLRKPKDHFCLDYL